MVYEWTVKGIYKTDANIAGKVCEELSNTVGLTKKNLVDASRSEDAPLHNEFEWRDDIAAERYREVQASKIIRSLVVRQEAISAEPVRAYFKIANTFEPIESIIISPAKTTSLLEMALRELNSFRMKYSTLSELAVVFHAIDELQKGA